MATRACQPMKARITMTQIMPVSAFFILALTRSLYRSLLFTWFAGLGPALGLLLLGWRQTFLHRFTILLSGVASKDKPLLGLHIILRHSLSLGVHHGEVGLGFRAATLREGLECGSGFSEFTLVVQIRGGVILAALKRLLNEADDHSSKDDNHADNQESLQAR